MEKLEFRKYSRYAELPLDEFDRAPYSVYVIDKTWNYMFVNQFVIRNLGSRSEGMIGHNMWRRFPELTIDSAFRQLRENSEKGRRSNFVTISPITGQRLKISGYPLSDSFLFTSAILPQKEDLLNEMRKQLRRRAHR